MDYLYSVGKWAKFLSILGLINLGLIIVLGFSIELLMSSLSGEEMPFPTFVFGFMYLIMAGIYLYPTILLLKFVNFSKMAYLNDDSDNLTESFRNLKGVFQYVGVLTIIGLAFYAWEL